MATWPLGARQQHVGAHPGATGCIGHARRARVRPGVAGSLVNGRIRRVPNAHHLTRALLQRCWLWRNKTLSTM
ncbi:hypothetical protein xavtCFBP7764_22615 [Xanthomonas citri]|nr:hypothetical protein xavtCFBP7764_22615 [Xanthomonas citri]